MYEFKNKNGIADQLSDIMSMSHVSGFTDTVTSMSNNLKDLTQSIKKMRKLSIQGGDGSKKDLMSPTKKKVIDLNTVDVKTPTKLNLETLKTLPGVVESPNAAKDQELREYAQSLKSGVMSANRRLGRIDDSADRKSLNRFPSIQGSRNSMHTQREIQS